MCSVQPEGDNEVVVAEEILEPTFKDLAKEVIKNYINSVLVVDDDYLEVVKRAESLTQVTEPGEDEKIFLRLFRELRLSMTENGCLLTGFPYDSALPDGEERAAQDEMVFKISQKADFLILDWHLNDGGKFVLELLKKLHNFGLTFICIYTKETDLEGIRTAIYNSLSLEPPGEIEFDFVIDNLIVCVREKPKYIEEKEFENPNILNPRVLIDQVCDNLTKIYGGYLQLSALELVTKHRASIQKTLVKFKEEMDTAFLLDLSHTHSPLRPEDGFLLDIFIDEWKSQLQNMIHLQGAQIFSKTGLSSYLGSFADEIDDKSPVRFLKYLKKLDNKIKNNEKIFPRLTRLPEDPEFNVKLIRWLKSGLKSSKFPVYDPNWATQDMDCVCMSMVLTLLKSRGLRPRKDEIYDSLLPLDSLIHQGDLLEMLSQGTIFEVVGSDDKYLICITPLCDIANPKESGNYYRFVLAEKLQDPLNIQEPFCVIQPENSLPSILRIRIKKTYTLKFSDNGIKPETMEVELAGSEWQNTREGKITLKPIAQLRNDHAFKISGLISSDSARIGVNQVESLRALAHKNSQVN